MEDKRGTLAARVLALGEDFLDEAVHDTKSMEATTINDRGIIDQMAELGLDYVEELVSAHEKTIKEGKQ